MDRSFCCTDGCKIYCGNSSKQGISDSCYRCGSKWLCSKVSLWQDDLWESCIWQQGCCRSFCWDPVWTKYQRLARDACTSRKHAVEGCFWDSWSSYNNRWADPIWRDIILPFQFHGLAEFALSSKDPAYVVLAKAVQKAKRPLNSECPQKHSWSKRYLDAVKQHIHSWLLTSWSWSTFLQWSRNVLPWTAHPARRLLGDGQILPWISTSVTVSNWSTWGMVSINRC